MLSEIVNFRICLKNPALMDVARLAGPRQGGGVLRRGKKKGPAGSGAGSRREKQSHKVATRSRRLACLSRVNIGPRLHTVMTNRGGRAQKRYQDGYLVLTEPTHAIPVIFLPLLSSKPARSCGAERRRRGGLGARLLTLVPASFVKAVPSRLSSKHRDGREDGVVAVPHAELLTGATRLIRAAEAQHNNRKFWVIGSILRSDPQLFDWFSFNWLSSATWHHQSFRLEVREMKRLHNTISTIRHLHFRSILECDRNHRLVRLLLS